jgi:hypothetical protein
MSLINTANHGGHGEHGEHAAKQIPLGDGEETSVGVGCFGRTFSEYGNGQQLKLFAVLAVFAVVELVLSR